MHLMYAYIVSRMPGITAISRETILTQDYRHKGKQADNDE